MKHIIKKGDIVLIITLLVLSFIPEGIFYLTGNDASLDRTYAVIQVDGKVYKEVPLSGHHGTDTISIDTDKGHNLVEGFVSKPGATVVCLPHKVLVEVKSAGSDEPDVIPAH